MMVARPRTAFAVLALLGAACSNKLPTSSGEITVMPTEGPDLRSTLITIHGGALNALIHIDVGSSSDSVVDPRMRALLGTVELKEVRLVAKNTLLAVVPQNMPRGTYDLTVIDALGNRLTKPMAFVVRGTDCGDFSGASGADCSGCERLEGCHCVQSTICAPVCGDGVLRGNKECDDGNQNDGDGCSHDCRIEPGWVCPVPGQPCLRIGPCGTGIVGPGKECDDGNTRDGDGCDSMCRVERGWTCTGQPSVCTPICGDGLIRGMEQCDTGNTTGGMGCSPTCRIEPGWACTGEPSVCRQTCGNGRIDPGEECDDGVGRGGMGCSNICRIERGWACAGEPSVCHPICGDCLVVGDEMCDDCTTTGLQGCSADCKRITRGYVCPPMGGACHTVCGDRIIAGDETCDDGTGVGGHGCSATCHVEMGWICMGEPSVCNTVCGDGLIRGMEQCDDGNMINGDGCDSMCRIERGWGCMGEPSVCNAICGDGLIRGREQCDDGNTRNNDGCDSMCRIERGWLCAGEPSICNPICGDGLVRGPETCDDGTARGGHGCSATCRTEPGYHCVREPSICNLLSTTTFVDAAHPCPGAGTLDNPYCSVSLGIDSNRPVLVAHSGTYNIQGIDIDHRSLKLIGEPGTIIAAEPTAPVLFFFHGTSTATVIGVTLSGGMSRVLIADADVELREVVIGPGAGAGVDVSGNSRFVIDRSRVMMNAGGGVFLDTSRRFLVADSIIDHNGMTGPNNSVPLLISQAATGSRVVNDTIVDNTSGTNGGNIAAVRCRIPFTGIVNTIVYNNVVAGMPAGIGPLCGATYSDLDPQALGLGNLAVDPMFGANYHLTPSSPVINQGDPAGVVPNGPAPLLDFDGVRRPRGPRVDIGALERP